MITPMDIHNKTFTRKLRGYAEDEVNSFLEEVVSDYERIYREHREMEEQLDVLKSRLSHFEKMEATMSATLVMAQETAESVRQSAQKEAELIVREAHAKGEQIIAEADSRRRQINETVIRVENDLRLYMEKVRANLTSAMAMIEAVKAEQAPKDEEAPKAEETPRQEESSPTIEEAMAMAAAAMTAEETVSAEEAVPAEEEADRPPMSDLTREILAKIFPEEASARAITEGPAAETDKQAEGETK